MPTGTSLAYCTTLILALITIPHICKEKVHCEWVADHDSLSKQLFLCLNIHVILIFEVFLYNARVQGVWVTVLEKVYGRGFYLNTDGTNIG